MDDMKPEKVAFDWKLGAIRRGLSHRESMNQLMILLVAIIGISGGTDGWDVWSWDLDFWTTFIF